MPATSNGPDLSFARAQIERLMDDQCTVYRDPDAEFDDVLDVDTGEIVPPDHDSRIVYQGKCYFRLDGRQNALVDQGGVQRPLRGYQLVIPATADCLEAGDVAVCTASRRDRALVDQEFIVTDVITKSFLVSRKAELVRKI